MAIIIEEVSAEVIEQVVTPEESFPVEQQHPLEEKELDLVLKLERIERRKRRLLVD